MLENKPSKIVENHISKGNRRLSLRFRQACKQLADLYLRLVPQSGIGSPSGIRVIKVIRLNIPICQRSYEPLGFARFNLKIQTIKCQNTKGLIALGSRICLIPWYHTPERFADKRYIENNIRGKVCKCDGMLPSARNPTPKFNPFLNFVSLQADRELITPSKNPRPAPPFRATAPKCRKPHPPTHLQHRTPQPSNHTKTSLTTMSRTASTCRPAQR